jgi:hypothetical protein
MDTAQPSPPARRSAVTRLRSTLVWSARGVDLLDTASTVWSLAGGHPAPGGVVLGGAVVCLAIGETAIRVFRHTEHS